MTCRFHVDTEISANKSASLPGSFCSLTMTSLAVDELSSVIACAVQHLSVAQSPVVLLPTFCGGRHPGRGSTWLSWAELSWPDAVCNVFSRWCCTSISRATESQYDDDDDDELQATDWRTAGECATDTRDYTALPQWRHFVGFLGLYLSQLKPQQHPQNVTRLRFGQAIVACSLDWYCVQNVVNLHALE